MFVVSILDCFVSHQHVNQRHFEEAASGFFCLKEMIKIVAEYLSVDKMIKLKTYFTCKETVGKQDT